MALGGCRLWAIVATALAAASPAFSAAASFSLEPYQMVRSLQLIQDRIANGDSAAMPMQARLLQLIDERLRKLGEKQFKDRRNFHALLMYAMSGGNPRTVTALLSDAKLTGTDKVLADGVSGYVNGQPAVALSALSDIDPLAEEAELGAFIALIKGSVDATVNPADALKSLDEARLLAPGTLVEEAALRRTVSIAVKLGDATRFLRASDQYMRRFLHSPYAGQFADSFVSGIVALHDQIDPKAVAATIADMDAEHRRFIYLRLARASTIAGLTEMASFASRLADPSTFNVADPTDQRAMLYSSIASITSDNVRQMIGKLKSINPGDLSAPDRRLLDAALKIAREVTSQPAELMTDTTAPPPLPPKQQDPMPAANRMMSEPEVTSIKATRSTVDEARKQMEAIDKLLKEDPQ